MTGAERSGSTRRGFLAGGLGAAAAAAAAGAAFAARPGPVADPTAGPRRPTVDTDALRTGTEYDYVVVGAGAGGVPLAVRLAEAGHSVLVLEAGPASTDPDVYSVPAFHLFASSDPQMSWDFWVRHYTDTDAHGSAFVPERGGVLYPRASTLGGCTAHHALLMLAPESDDWDRIGRTTGDRSWNAFTMQRYQQRVREWLPIETSPAAILTEDPTLARIVTAALVETGHLAPAASDVDVEQGTVGGTLLDPNDPPGIEAYREGTFLVPQSTRDGKRYGTRERLLESVPGLDGRLAIQTDALVERVVFEDDRDGTPRAVGADVVVAPYQYGASPLRRRLRDDQRAAARVRVTAKREVIVATGAFNTPQLLMLSGVGPAAHLRHHGIDVVVDSPGVGGNLQDRYEMTVVTEYDREFSVVQGKTYGQPGDPGMREWRSGDPNALYRSNGILVGIKRKVPDGSDHPELFVFGAPSNFTGYRPGFAEDGLRGGNHFNWAVIRGYQQSMDGTVRLRNADPTEPPEINFRYFDDDGDSDGVRQDLRAVREGLEEARRIDRTAQRLRFGDAATDREVYPGSDKRDESLDAVIRKDAWGHHASCTARMGADDEPLAVLDSDFRVRGTRALRVVDASAFPTIPALFPLMTIFAMSERAADRILDDRSTR